MLIFNEPFKPKKPKLPKAATAEGDLTAEQKAEEEAQRRARAAVAGSGRQASLLSGGASSFSGKLKSLLGVG